MTIRTLFSIILKTMGIFSLGSIVTAIPQLISAISYITGDYGITDVLPYIFSSIFLLALVTLIPYYLLFKTNFIIDTLQLDKGYTEETVQFNIQNTTVLNIAIIIIAGLILIDEIPGFANSLFSYFQKKVSAYDSGHIDMPIILIPVIKITIALILLSFRRQIIAWIEAKEAKQKP